MSLHTRRVPIYLLIDCSAGMTPAALGEARQAMNTILQELLGDPQMLESGHLSVILFGGDAKQVVPLDELFAFTAPELPPPRGACALGAALRLLDQCLQKEVQRATPTTKGDYKPVVLLLSSGRPADDWQTPLAAIRKRRVQLVALAPSAGADHALLKQVTEIVHEMKSLTGQLLHHLLKIMSDKVGSAKIGDSNVARPRRLPVYFLLDCSPTLDGPAVAATRRFLQSIVNDLRGDPMAIETAHLSFLGYSDRAEQLCPLTEVMAFKLPSVKRGRASALGAAFQLLEACFEREVRQPTPRRKGDFKPLVFLLTSGRPTDAWQPAVQRVRERRPASILAVATGPGADRGVLKQITEIVLDASQIADGSLHAFFKWVSASIKTTSDPVEGLPPLPSAGGGHIIP